ncbi:unnamed protein product [Rhizopus stolonifer]
MALDILKAEIAIDQFNFIIRTQINSVQMSDYANEIVSTLENAPLSVHELRQKLYSAGFHANFDVVTNEDAEFMKVTIIYFLDLISSPNNPLNKFMLEGTAASYLIIYLVNQLFIVNNDVIELGWLERELYSTDQTKSDGVLFKVGNKSISPALFEFSEGINDKTSAQKNSRDIEKLHRNMIKVMNDTKTDRMFCMRCYDHYIYFERLIEFDGTMYRKIDATIKVPNTPRKLKAYIKEIPMIFAWKQAVINHVIDLN